MNLSWVSAGFVILAWGVTFANTRALLRDFSALEIQLLRFALAVWGATEQGYYALDGSFSVTLDADINLERFSRPMNWVNIAFLGVVASAACFVLRSPQEAAGKVHVHDREGEAVREQTRRGEALLLQAPVMQLTQWRREGFPCRHEAV